jgi:sugar lactone lactonase YvrE
MRFRFLAIALALLLSFIFAAQRARAERTEQPEHWLWSTAWHIPSETTSEESGYFALIEGRNGRVYIGAAKYGDNAFLVEFDPAAARSGHGKNPMRIVVDAEKEIGVDRKGFAAQAKFHSRGNVGESGRIYHGTKQGYPQEGEKRSDYLGGHPIVYDPATGKSRVYDIPIPHQGVISVAPDESRGVAYISTCSDERPIESTHFMILDLATGKYRDLLDCRHMYAFIVVDHLGRAYHPIVGGEIARYDPRTDELTRLKQTIDGKPPSEQSLLAHPESHPINWEISPDRKTLYAVAMSGNQLYAYDLTGEGDTLAGRSLGALVPDARATDCRALCVAHDGTVWAGVATSYLERPSVLRLVSFRPGDPTPTDRGPIAIGNSDYTTFTDAAGKTKPHHNGVERLDDGTLIPLHSIMGICAARDGTVYATTLSPFTLHAIRFPKVAGITTEYRHNSHADLLLSRMLETDTLDGKGERPVMSLASLVTDQVPPSDTSRALSKRHGFPIFDAVGPALTLENEKSLAVDGVLLVAEHGNYPLSDTGQVVYPKRRTFEQIAATFRASGQSVPVFIDKHLADNWTDAKWIYDTAKELGAPLMAGSSLPVLWRYPPEDVRRGAKLKEIVAVSYHTLDGYGFHALEIVQALAERRAGGETGVASVQCLTGKAVWEAETSGLYDRRLLDLALSRLKERPLPPGKSIEELVAEPVLFVINYRDGLRASVFTLNHAVGEWTAAWRYASNEKNNEKQDGESASALFWTQEARPFMHFAHQLTGVEKMMQTLKPTWPVERTLLTSGVLDALLISKRDGGKPLATPWLDVQYQSKWDWRQPPPPPPSRPISGQ